MRSLEWFIKKGLLVESKTIDNLTGSFMEKARENLVTMELLDKTRDQKEILKLPEDYDPSEWIVITGYYAMYLSALSVLAENGYKSKNHAATIKALEEMLVKKEILEDKYLEVLKDLKIEKDEIENLDRAKNRREIAQYSVTKETTKRIAKRTMDDAHNFVDRMEKLLDSLK